MPLCDFQQYWHLAMAINCTDLKKINFKWYYTKDNASKFNTAHFTGGWVINWQASNDKRQFVAIELKCISVSSDFCDLSDL